jgi:hypothetical protein
VTHSSLAGEQLADHPVSTQSSDDAILSEFAKFPAVLKLWQKIQLARALLAAQAAQAGEKPVAWLSGDAHSQWIDLAEPKLGVADGEGLVTDWTEPLAGPRTLELVRTALAAQQAAEEASTIEPVAEVVMGWTLSRTQARRDAA